MAMIPMIEGGEITDTTHQGTCTVVSGWSVNETINGKHVLLDPATIMVSGGKTPPQVGTATLTMHHTGGGGVTMGGKGMICLNDFADGTGQYQVGDSVVPQPIHIVVTNAGQGDVTAT